MKKIPGSEITPEHIYLNRRQFMTAGALSAGALALAACGGSSLVGGAASGKTTQAQGAAAPTSLESVYGAGALPPELAYAEPYASSTTDEIGDPLNKFDEITNYNNYYEFTTNKEAVAKLAQNFTAYPWQIEVTGLVDKPQTIDLDAIYKKFAQEERIYRLRCVEAWSMVIPWVGFPIAALLKEVSPKSTAQYVRFVSIMRPEEMPGQNAMTLEWPYQEGLRMDEAMNPLAIFATGMYGKPLTNQQGAPFRLVVPWKYGFKSIKGIVKIELTDSIPPSTWNTAAPNEYGFYANVNPQVDHPRWSQASERRIGEIGRRETLMFNGYEEEVASLYTGMDLARSY
ncbi:MAG: protein-methionine-sulfoxide reductase catalytic subunit MsrP [Anaerolineales bacterium]|nr:protein-methionine-sulfoxide reductase catalytic subunit MsrP [Anaerolineales bacterium]